MVTHSVPRRSETKSGFTLVELLVVIGIIALLISILLPSLQAARRQADTVKCLSSLRQIGMAFQFYERDFKGAVPTVVQYYPDLGTNPMPKPAKSNDYWIDRLMPYFTKSGKMNFNITKQQDFDAARKTVFWGCPAWEGWMGPSSNATYKWGGISKYENGYSMNRWPTTEAGYPADPSKMPPGTEQQMRWTGSYEGKCYRITQWSHPSERMLLCDANLWLLGFNPVSTEGAPIAPQHVLRALASSAGTSNIDYYRHGKYPPLNGANFSTNGGKVAFNVLFVDGHASTLTDRREGYKAVRMRYP
jgi:prepilin-type N-terminal cleavage/methylation domain-containing protein/prepilin-type processing-associated H-X9-DG protein